MDERLTKKQLKEQRKFENLKKMEESQTSSGSFGKIIIIGVVILLFLGLAAYLFVSSKIAQKERAEKPVSLSDSGQKIGSESAKITLIEFGDFQCPACKVREPALKQVREVYKDDVLFIFKHFPLRVPHPNAMPAAIAAEAAGRQGKFWQFHDLLYERQDEWANLPSAKEKFVEYASELELDTEKFSKDLSDSSIETLINEQNDEGIKAGVSGTPAFFLNGKPINIGASFDDFKKEIDDVISKLPQQ